MPIAHAADPWQTGKLLSYNQASSNDPDMVLPSSADSNHINVAIDAGDRIVYGDGIIMRSPPVLTEKRAYPVAFPKADIR